MFTFNEPIWVLDKIKGFFERYVDHNDPYGLVMIGVPSRNGGVGVVVPEEWIRKRDIDG